MLKRKNFSRRKDETLNIPAKANRILNIVLVAMIFIVLRIWHLAVVQHDEKLIESRKPQRRVQLEPSVRATIRDRFNVPLAINKLQYNATILYSQIRRVPSVAWETGPDGIRKKRYKRREYITALSEVLGNELGMDPERVEDLVHAKAALYNQIPFTLKENISETEYYRLKMMENDWPGISVQKVPARFYPMGKVASDIIGYMGAINRQEYEAIIREMTGLRRYIEAVEMGEDVPLPDGVDSIEEAQKRYIDLQELAYSTSDSIGKGGIEGRFEKVLRGFRGKRSYYSDARGNIISELPGSRDPLSGKRILLTISADLQAYAEQLLIENEKIRHPVMSHLGPVKRNITADKEPWMKGGAIIAMDPKNGEIIAMATHPRYDPNDFIPSGDAEEDKRRKRNILKWLESDVYLGDIWDRQRPLERELYGKVKGIYLDELPLTWDNYLSLVLNRNSPLNQGVLSSATVADAVAVQRNVEGLLDLLPSQDLYQVFSFLYKDEGVESHGKKMSLKESDQMEEAFDIYGEDIGKIRSTLDRYLRAMSIYDKVLLVDLCRVAVQGEKVSDALLRDAGKQRIADYREASGAMVKISGAVKKMVRDVFHASDFKEWRAENEKEFLKGVREEEKSKRRYARPYIDYLDFKENELFNPFWEENKYTFISFFLQGNMPSCCRGEGLEVYLDTLGSWHREIENGAHRQIEWAGAYFLLKDIVDKLPDGIDLEYLQSFRSFQQLDRPLYGKYPMLRKGSGGLQQEKHLAAAFYPKYGYGYGRSQAYRQSSTQGSIFKLVTAYQSLVQSYKEHAANGSVPADLSPLEMVDQVTRKGNDLYVGALSDGTLIPRHYKGGRMPRSLSTNIGRIDVTKAIECSSNPYFALLAGEYLESPNDLVEAARNFSYGSRTGIDLPGEISGNLPNDVDFNKTGLYAFSIGQHTLVATPLQTCVMLSSLVNGGKIFKPKLVDLLVGKEPDRSRDQASEKGALATLEQENSVIRMPSVVQREIFLPPQVQRTLLDGMCRVVGRTQKEGLGGLTRLYRDNPEVIKNYISLKKQLIGKTSTSESVENIDLDKDKGTNIYTHVWFGGISYEQDILDEDNHRFVFRDSFGSPELVVVVYLRYGGYGKEAAPVAALVAKKWKEIKQQR